MMKRSLSLLSPARPLWCLLAAALLLPLAFPGAASAIEIRNVRGDGTCPAGWTPLTFADAVANKSAACAALGPWDIARLADGGSMDGSGYECQLRGADKRTLGNSLCAKRETLEKGKLKVCLYPGFLPFVGIDGKGTWIGWDVTFLVQFASRQGLEFVPVRIEKFDDIWTLPGQGVCDIAASGISDLPSRRRQTRCAGDWSDHYYSVYRAFAVRTADKGKLNRIEDLVGKTVIVTGGSTAESDLDHRLACARIARCANGNVTSSCVNIKAMDNEEEAAKKVLKGEAFAYGGGLGSIQYLSSKLGGLSPAWAHCNQLQDCTTASEPFSFVVRHASTGLLEALNEYIAHPTEPYQGVPPDNLHCPPASCF